MLRSFASQITKRGVLRPTVTVARPFSSLEPVDPEDMPYFHHRPRFTGYEKFKSPRKRASKLLNQLNQEAVEKSKTINPKIWELDIRTGDAVEIHMVSQGGVHAKDGDDTSQEIDKIRGVVLGKVNRGLASSLILRDVVFGEVIERKVPMHSPMIKEAKVLERNFIFKGKKKVKRAKLYYLRDLNPLRKYQCKLRSVIPCCVFNPAKLTFVVSMSFVSLPLHSMQGVQVLNEVNYIIVTKQTYLTT